MKKLIVILFIISYHWAFSQSSAKMFKKEWLDNPVTFADSIDNCFRYSEIDSFSFDTGKTSVLLQNGYAKAKLINANDWKSEVRNRSVNMITIIFTKYPLYKKDWITNYYVLLASRLKELFRLDQSLNAKSIKWNLLLQTNCVTAYRAEKMFHGILIEYNISNKPKLHKDSVSQKIKTVKKQKATPDKDMKKETEWNDYYDNNETLYNIAPRAKKGKIKNRKEPECPDFNQKRKFRLFKKRKK